MFRSALDELGLDPAEAVYVGDSWMRDVVGASEAGMHPIWIRRPNVDPATQPDGRPVTILNSLSGLLALEPHAVTPA
jgi:putative hydrolase of the HAD superfamily